MTQSSQVSAPARIGAPDGAGAHGTHENLSAPALPNVADTSCCAWLSTLTQKCPKDSMCGQVRAARPGQNNTSGGSRDSAANDWHAKPTGSASRMAVTTVTPVQK